MRVRQHQVGEQISEAPGPKRRVHTKDRKPAQVDGGDDDEDQAEPEGRHVANDERGAHAHPIDRGPLPRRRQNTEHDAGGGRQAEARAGEDQRVAELRQQQLDDRLVHDGREAKVAVQRAPEPLHVLHVNGLIEPERAAELGQRLGGPHRAEQRPRHVAGDELHPEEDHDGDAEEHGHESEEPLSDVGGHEGGPSSRARRRSQ